MRRFFLYSGVVWVLLLLVSGSAIAAGRARSPDTFLLVGVDHETSGLYTDLLLVDIVTCERVQLPLLAINDSLAWSPDGSQIAFLSTMTGSQAIHTAHWTGANSVRRTWDFTTDTHLAYSPDGRSLAFTAATDSEYDLVRLDLETGDETVLTPAGSVEMSPSWVPDGSQIVHVASGSGHFHIAALDLASGNATVLVDLDGRWVFEPQVSPDGSRIAFFSSNNNYTDFRLHVVERDGTPLWDQILTQNLSEYVLGLRWSPDGQWIGYLLYSGGVSRLIVTAADGSGAELPIECLPRAPIAFTWKQGR